MWHASIFLTALMKIEAIKRLRQAAEKRRHWRSLDTGDRRSGQSIYGDSITLVERFHVIVTMKRLQVIPMFSITTANFHTLILDTIMIAIECTPDDFQLIQKIGCKVIGRELESEKYQYPRLL